MSMRWNILDFPDDIRIYLSDESRKELYEFLKGNGNRNNLALRLGISTSICKSYFQTGMDSQGLRTYIPVRILKNSIGVIDDNRILQRIEQGVVSYRSRAGTPVLKPKLPLEETPELYSIIAHMICDGSAPARKTPYYANTRHELINEMRKNLQIFGVVRTVKHTNQNNVEMLSFPKVITDILSHIFKIRFSPASNIPERVFLASDECKCAFIRAMFDDEGTFSSRGREITFVQKNRDIVIELKKLLMTVGIESGKICEQSGCHYMSILSASRIKFYERIGFTHELKSEKLRMAFLTDKNRQMHEKLDKRITELLLREGPLDRFQIAMGLNANINSVTDILYKRLRNRAVMSKFNGKNKNYLWSMI